MYQPRLCPFLKNTRTNCRIHVKGKYSKIFTKHNPDFETEQPLVLNEFENIGWDSIYICGVIKKGYPKSNYPHNVHFTIIPKKDAKSEWSFEQWKVTVTGGIIEEVISEEELDIKYSNSPIECKTCRMFRWAVTHYKL